MPHSIRDCNNPGTPDATDGARPAKALCQISARFEPRLPARLRGTADSGSARCECRDGAREWVLHAQNHGHGSAGVAGSFWSASASGSGGMEQAARNYTAVASGYDA